MPTGDGTTVRLLGVAAWVFSLGAAGDACAGGLARRRTWRGAGGPQGVLKSGVSMPQWLSAVVGKARVGVDGGANGELWRSEVGVGRFFEAYELSFSSSVLVVCEA
eukprot:SAG31_NODE_82_length_27046_cov_45.857275_28_plen_106_part_00